MSTSTRPALIPLPLPFHDPSATRQARDRMIALPFSEFAGGVARLLERMGYRDVRLMGIAQGRNEHGGLDLRATLPNDLTQTLVVAQVKQYRGPVPRKFVDEIRGTMLRLGAQQGLLVTTSSFAPAAREAASAAQNALPVRLMDGGELAALMALHGVSTGQDEGKAAGYVPRNPSAGRQEVRQAGRHGIPPEPPCAPRPPCFPGRLGSMTVIVRIGPDGAEASHAGG